MQKFRTKIKDHKFELHLTALLLMLIPPIPMFYAAQAGNTILIWLLVAIIMLGNLLVVVVP